jgi:histidine triad (HIT) family protein
MNTADCPFCKIIRREAPASVITEDDDVIAFMTLRPARPGECMVIPKAHIDHFTDVSDEIAATMITTAQAIGRIIRTEFECQRVGYVVHGFGVAHAHLVIVPQHGPYDIASVDVVGDVVALRDRQPVDRAVLDAQAQRLTPKTRD